MSMRLKEKKYRESKISSSYLNIKTVFKYYLSLILTFFHSDFLKPRLRLVYNKHILLIFALK